MASTAPPKKATYFHKGQALDRPPLSARITRFFDAAYLFLGLYLTTLFSFNHAVAAQTSPFAATNRRPGQPRPSPRAFFPGGSGGGPSGGSGGGGSGGKGPWGGGGGAGGGSGKRLGRVDDVRGPECKSCG